MALVPSRILIWTSPYKQLSEDPGVVVAMEKEVGQIDQLYPNSPSPLIDETEKRVRTAISDAGFKMHKPVATIHFY